MNSFRLAFRTLRKTPGFTAIAVATLGLGIGANAAIFSLVHEVLLKPLPFHDAASLVSIWDTYQPRVDRAGASPTEVALWSQQTDIFSETAWYRTVPQNLALTLPGSDAVETHACPIPANLLPVLGAAPALGHAFTANEPPNSVLLGDRLWRGRFGADAAIVGRTIRMSGADYVVAGVMPAGFALPDWADVWLPPVKMGDELTNPVRHSLGVVARLRPGVTVAAATRRLADLTVRLAAEHPKTSKGWNFGIDGLQQDLTAGMRPALTMLFGAVSLVLLIACANVANLLLSRAASRRKEIAVRTALGASASQLVRQLLAESLVLTALGAGLGLALAEFALARFSPVPAPLDGSVLLFLLGISALTGVVFGLIPALQIFDVDLGATMKSAAPAAGGSRRMRGALVVSEFALALILAAGAGVLVKSFVRLMHIDPGFHPGGLLTLRLSLPAGGNPGAMFQRIDERLRSLPGVESVAAANALPLVANRAIASRFFVPESPLMNPDAPPSAQLRLVTPAFFGAMRIPLRSGREFTAADFQAPVAIVNQSMAERFWPGRDPVGLKFVTGPWGPNPSYSTIIGVAGNVKQFGLDSETTLDIYYPAPLANYLIVRTTGRPEMLAAAVRRELRAIAPDAPVSDLRTMDDVLSESAHSRRWTMGLLAGFAGLALLLALVGIYGVMAWTVAQRTREIGIRMALGADTGQVRLMVIGYGLKLCGIGMALGLAGAFGLRRVLSSLVFGVSEADPLVYAAVAASMLLVASFAAYIPARRASRVDPAIALRWD